MNDQISTTTAKRYPRTFGGLIASMIVLVLAVVGYWVLQNATHKSVDSNINAIADWKTTVVQLQQGGVPVDYPASIPSGWSVTSANYDTTTVPGHPIWEFGMTNGTQFVGLYEQKAAAKDLLARAVGHDEVSKVLPGQGHLTIVLHATGQAEMSAFEKTLTTKTLPQP